ncbi:MAG TPA: hypothetical protein GXX51_02140 [Firmicutes bacterium]|nr:hypothetical protein [Bacillota bacterium]
MNRILSVLEREGLRCVQYEPLSLDINPFVEYQDSDEHPAEMLFERPAIQAGKKRVNEIDESIPTILHYFLDGSRRTYKVADLMMNGRYLPLIAGQIGVAVMKRREDGRSTEPMRKFCRLENVLALPDEMINKDDLPGLADKINKDTKVRLTLVRYEVKKDRDPVDLGVARIMRHMQDLEVEVVAALSESNYLQNDSMLVVDGPLRFKEMKGRPFDIVQFRNVIGLSKTFRPSFTVGKGRRREDVGTLTFGLAFGERTSVFKTMEGDKIIGMWYLRIRPTKMMANPLQGIVKLERYAIAPEEKEDGFEGELVDNISSFILRERNVTPYDTDSRWASHIYPIYMAETYIKSSFMSDIRFKALF